MKRSQPLKRTGIKRKPAKPRKFKTPRCTTQRCGKPQRVHSWCVSHAEQTADRRFSRWIRARDDRCTAAGVFDTPCDGPLQAAHIIGRRRYSVRFDEANVHALCRNHHMHVDQHGSEHAKYHWAVSILGADGFDALMERGSQTVMRAQACEAELAIKRGADGA